MIRPLYFWGLTSILHSLCWLCKNWKAVFPPFCLKFLYAGKHLWFLVCGAWGDCIWHLAFVQFPVMDNGVSTSAFYLSNSKRVAGLQSQLALTLNSSFNWMACHHKMQHPILCDVMYNLNRTSWIYLIFLLVAVRRVWLSECSLLSLYYIIYLLAITTTVFLEFIFMLSSFYFQGSNCFYCWPQIHEKRCLMTYHWLFITGKKDHQSYLIYPNLSSL